MAARWTSSCGRRWPPAISSSQHTSLVLQASRWGAPTDGCGGAVRDDTCHATGPGERIGPVSTTLLPTCRHLPIRRQPLVVTRFPQAQAGRGVTPRLPPHVRRVADTCRQFVKRSSSHRLRTRAARPETRLLRTFLDGRDSERVWHRRCQGSLVSCATLFAASLAPCPTEVKKWQDSANSA
jgi:hypothetical protein